jgi:hypothetical protein
MLMFDYLLITIFILIEAHGVNAGALVLPKRDIFYAASNQFVTRYQQNAKKGNFEVFGLNFNVSKKIIK